jgi:hypothetical protein
MRYHVLVLVLGAAAMCCGCIQSNPDDEQESVETAEQPIFASPPPKTGFWLVPLLPAIAIHAKLPAFKAQVAFAEDATQPAGGDDDDDDDGGDPR